VVRSTANGEDPNTATVSDAMTGEVETCFDDQCVREVTKCMEKLKIRRMAVVDHIKKLVGVVSLADLVNKADKKLACEAFERVSVPA
jgi:CBS domain-containing protein